MKPRETWLPKISFSYIWSQDNPSKLYNALYPQLSHTLPSKSHSIAETRSNNKLEQKEYLALVKLIKIYMQVWYLADREKLWVVLLYFSPESRLISGVLVVLKIN